MRKSNKAQSDMEEVIRLLIKEYGYEEVQKELEKQGRPALSEEKDESINEDSDENDETEEEPRVYKIKTPEEIKKEREDHLAAIKVKRKELKKKGISSMSLLTKENMEKWLNSGMSYNRIAREEVGLSEKIVSSKAKEYGLTSKIGHIIRLRRAGVF
jgi:predicted  nucleic acid-binding Zn-ribbon protein